MRINLSVGKHSRGKKSISKFITGVVIDDGTDRLEVRKAVMTR
jgi:hypothetical protein